MEETTPTVYVVDDDTSVQRALARLIRSVGLQAAPFASAQAFLASPPPAGPACLVFDVRLAGENGLALQEALHTTALRWMAHSRQEGAHVDSTRPVIAIVDDDAAPRIATAMMSTPRKPCSSSLTQP